MHGMVWGKPYLTLVSGSEAVNISAISYREVTDTHTQTTVTTLFTRRYRFEYKN